MTDDGVEEGEIVDDPVIVKIESELYGPRSLPSLPSSPPSPALAPTKIIYTFDELMGMVPDLITIPAFPETSFSFWLSQMGATKAIVEVIDLIDGGGNTDSGALEVEEGQVVGDGDGDCSEPPLKRIKTEHDARPSSNHDKGAVSSVHVPPLLPHIANGGSRGRPLPAEQATPELPPVVALNNVPRTDVSNTNIGGLLQRGASEDMGQESSDKRRVVTDTTLALLRRQLEHYFGDSNYLGDKFLLSQADDDNWIPLVTIIDFKKMKEILNTDPVEPRSYTAAISLAIQSSTVCEIDESKMKIRRIDKLPSKAKSRKGNEEATVMVSNLHPSTDEELVWELMMQVGPVVRVSILPPKNPDLRVQGPIHGYVEYANERSVPYAINVMHGVVLKGYTIGVKSASIITQNELSKGELFVRNIAQSVTEDKLKHYMSSYGTVASISMNMGKRDGPQGFVVMSTAEEADRVVREMDGTNVEGFNISINLSDRARRARSVNGGALETEREREERTGGDLCFNEVFIGPVPYHVTQPHLISLFQQYGSILNINRVRNNCFVSMKTTEGADSAVADLHGRKLWDGPVTASLSDKAKAARSSPHFTPTKESRARDPPPPPPTSTTPSSAIVIDLSEESNRNAEEMKPPPKKQLQPFAAFLPKAFHHKPGSERESTPSSSNREWGGRESGTGSATPVRQSSDSYEGRGRSSYHSNPPSSSSFSTPTSTGYSGRGRSPSPIPPQTPTTPSSVNSSGYGYNGGYGGGSNFRSTSHQPPAPSPSPPVTSSMYAPVPSPAVGSSVSQPSPNMVSSSSPHAHVSVAATPVTQMYTTPTHSLAFQQRGFEMMAPQAISVQSQIAPVPHANRVYDVCIRNMFPANHQVTPSVWLQFLQQQFSKYGSLVNIDTNFQDGFMVSLIGLHGATLAVQEWNGHHYNGHVVSASIMESTKYTAVPSPVVSAPPPRPARVATFICGKCNTTLQLPPGFLAGSEGRCPTCMHQFYIGGDGRVSYTAASMMASVASIAPTPSSYIQSPSFHQSAPVNNSFYGSAPLDSRYR